MRAKKPPSRRKKTTKKTTSSVLPAQLVPTGQSMAFISSGEEHIKTQRYKAKNLKQTRWWQNKLREGKCYYCSKKFKPEELSMEHLVPLSRGGMSLKNNIVLACKKCNFRKKHTTILELRLNKNKK